MAIFPIFFLGNIGHENDFYDTLERKRMVLLHKWLFFQRFYLGNIGQVNIFYDILKRKIAFLGYKINKFKSQKIDIFPKGLTHGFGPKMTIFPTFS